MSISLIDSYFGDPETQSVDDSTYNADDWAEFGDVEWDTNFGEAEVEMSNTETAIEVMDMCLAETESLIALMESGDAATPGHSYKAMMGMVGMEGFGDQLGLEGLKDKAKEIYRKIADFIVGLIRAARKLIVENMSSVARVVKGATKLKQQITASSAWGKGGDVTFSQGIGKYMANMKGNKFIGAADTRTFLDIKKMVESFVGADGVAVSLNASADAIEKVGSDGAGDGESLIKDSFKNMTVMLRRRLVAVEDHSTPDRLIYVTQDGWPGGISIKLDMPLTLKGAMDSPPKMETNDEIKGKYVAKMGSASREDALKICDGIISIGKLMLRYKSMAEKEYAAYDRVAAAIKKASNNETLSSEQKTYMRSLRGFVSVYNRLTSTFGSVISRGLSSWLYYAKKSYKLGTK